MIGAFYQQAVVADTTVLTTLPPRSMQRVAEVVKYGVIDDGFFHWLEESVVLHSRRNFNKSFFAPVPAKLRSSERTSVNLAAERY